MGYILRSGIWAMLWNAFGAALIFPLYCIYHGRRTPSRENGLSLQKGRALPNSALLGILVPVAILLTPHVDREPQQHQTIIALFLAAPIAIHFLQWLLAKSISYLLGEAGADHLRLVYVRLAYAITAVASAVPHFCVLTTSLLTVDQATSFTRVFIPVPFLVQRDSSHIILEGAHLFLQYDWLVFSLACMLWSVMLLLARTWKSTALDRAWVFILMILSTVCCGPGATVSAVLWLREGQIQDTQIQLE